MGIWWCDHRVLCEPVDVSAFACWKVQERRRDCKVVGLCMMRRYTGMEVQFSEPRIFLPR